MKNYNLIVKRQSTKTDLVKQNAIVKAIKDRNINKAEVHSGKERASSDTVLEGLTKREDRITKRGETVHDNLIKQKFQELFDKSTFDYDKFKNVFREIMTEKEEIPALEGSDEPTVDIPETAQIDFSENLPRKTQNGQTTYVDVEIFTKDEIDTFTDASTIDKYIADLNRNLNIYNSRLRSGNRGQHFIRNHEMHTNNFENLAKYIRYVKYKRETLQTGSSILTSINSIKERLQIQEHCKHL